MKFKDIVKTTLKNLPKIGIILKHLFVLAQAGDGFSDFDICIKQQFKGFKSVARNLVAYC